MFSSKGREHIDCQAEKKPLRDEAPEVPSLIVPHVRTESPNAVEGSTPNEPALGDAPSTTRRAKHIASMIDDAIARQISFESLGGEVQGGGATLAQLRRANESITIED